MLCHAFLVLLYDVDKKINLEKVARLLFISYCFGAVPVRVAIIWRSNVNS